MKSLRLYGPGDLRLVDEAVPEPSADDELVRVSAVGICGSDLHWYAESGIGDAVLTRPLVLGHEAGGVIESGPRRGRRVAIDPAIPCEACEQCQAGRGHLCTGIKFSGHGVMDGALREFNAKLIYCSISGYGQTGPSAELPAYAPVIHAASGYDMAHLAYQPGRSRPDYCGIYHADVLTGVYAFGAISAALYQRRSGQRGQHIDVSMLESMLSLTLNELQWSQFEVALPKKPMFGPLETADGYVMVAVASEKTFQNLVNAARHPEWITDPRFAKYADRRSNWEALMDGVESWSRTLPTEQCLVALNGHGVPCSAYRTVAEALNDPQIAHRGALSEVEDGGGTFRVLNLPFRMSGTRVSAARRIATLGEHTIALLRETGRSEDEIAAFSGNQ